MSQHRAVDGRETLPLNCLLAGDSIAVGLAQALNGGGTVCATAARVGARSDRLPEQVAARRDFPVVVISIGSNDPRSPLLETNLLRARWLLGGRQVGWVLPYDRNAAYRVTRVAFRFNDMVVDLAQFASRDRVHPNDYSAVARALLR